MESENKKGRIGTGFLYDLVHNYSLRAHEYSGVGTRNNPI